MSSPCCNQISAPCSLTRKAGTVSLVYWWFYLIIIDFWEILKNKVIDNYPAMIMRPWWQVLSESCVRLTLTRVMWVTSGERGGIIKCWVAHYTPFIKPAIYRIIISDAASPPHLHIILISLMTFSLLFVVNINCCGGKWQKYSIIWKCQKM